MTPEGAVRVTAPEQLILGATEDVKIEGYRVTLDASSVLKIEAPEMVLDVTKYELDANRVIIGNSSAAITLAGGSDPICLNDDGEIVKSQRVKAR